MFCTFLKRVFKGSRRWSWANPFVYAVACQRAKPDLTVISQGQNFDGALPAAACAKLGIPYVLISHKASEWWPFDELVEAGGAGYGEARKCYFVSEHNRRLTESQLGIALPQAVVVRNPVGIGREILAWPHSDVVKLACVGRLLAFEKGQDILFEVLSRPVWRERPIVLSVVGQGPNRQAFENRARQIGLRVSFRGFVDDIEEVWRTHHLLVLPSRAEGLPIALVEAMLCGRPCVATNVGGTAELIDSEAVGYMAEAPTVAHFEQALERAWQARQDWPSVGRAARERALSFVGEDPTGVMVAHLLAEAS